LRLFGFAVIFIAIGLLSGLIIANRSLLPWPTPKEEAITVRMADGSNVLGALVYIATDKTYFEEEGIHAVRVPYNTGRDALASLIAGKSDVAMAADTPIVTAALNQQKFSIIATVANSPRESGVIADASLIKKPQDLIGKKIGVTPNTSAEYFLETFLVHHGIPREKVKMVPIEPQEARQKLSSKEVAAVSVWNPFLGEAKEILGDAVTIFFGEFYTFTWNVLVSKEMARDQEKCRRIVRALIRANNFYEADPKAAKVIIGNYTRISQTTLTTALEGAEIGVSLDQSLIPHLERQAKWYSTVLNKGTLPIPNFLDYIFLEPMVQEAPEKVSIIR
jgi:NitT/TauT family transport system substrate-binding protein